VGDDIKVLVNVIDSTGSHVAATINTSTTRLNGFSTVPTVNTIGTGIYEVVFASVTPAPAEGDRLIAKINGAITSTGTAWTEYAIALKILADERGTDNVVVPTSDITAIKTKTDQLTFTVANQVDANSLTGGTSPADIYTYFTTGTNEDVFKADTSTLATAASIAALNDFNPSTDTVANVTTVGSVTNPVATDAASRTASQADVSALATAASIAALNDLSSLDVENAVWDASISSHNTGGTTGKALKNLKEGIVSYEGQVNDASATTTSFITNLASSIDDFYNSQTIHFISGILQGQSRLVLDYDGSTKTITVEEPLSSAPANGTEFIILSTHVHTIAEIADGVWDEQRGTRSSGSFGYYLDAQVSGISSGGGDASAANQTTIIGHLTDIKGGTFDDATDSLEAIRDRGDAAWTTGGGSGIYTLTVTVKDASDNLISGARVNIDGTTNTLASNAQGIVVFNIDAGSYTLVTSPPSGYETPTNVSVTISNDDTAEIVLTAISDAGEAGWLG
jgi:hypothetical protein